MIEDILFEFDVAGNERFEWLFVLSDAEARALADLLRMAAWRLSAETAGLTPEADRERQRAVAVQVADWIEENLK